VYRFPAERAARIAVETARSTLEDLGAGIEVVFCCFSARDSGIYRKLLSVQGDGG
jgi:O-acetyl-ADP-ribose deacetylase (regulator of RNase III)